MRTSRSDLVIKGFEFGSQSSTWSKVWTRSNEERRKGYQAAWSVAVKHKLAGKDSYPYSDISYCNNDKYIGGHFTIKPGKKGKEGRIIVTEDSNCDYRPGRDDEVIGKAKVPAKKRKILKEFWSDYGDDDWSSGAKLDNYGLLSFKVDVYRDVERVKSLDETNTNNSIIRSESQVTTFDSKFKYYLNIAAKNPDAKFPDLMVKVKPEWMKSSLFSGNPKAPSGFYESISSFEDIVAPDIRNDLTPIDETPVPLIQYYSSILPPISPE